MKNCTEKELEEESVAEELKDFLSSLQKEVEHHKHPLRLSFLIDLEREEGPRRQTITQLEQLGGEAMKNANNLTKLKLSVFSPAQVAQQLHLIEFNMFKKIHVATELASCGWAKDNGNELAPNVNELISHFNRVAFWVATRITTPKRSKKKIFYINFFIEVADECFRRNNFNSLMEIIAGLNNINVQSLPEWKVIMIIYSILSTGSTKVTIGIFEELRRRHVNQTQLLKISSPL